MNYRNDIFFQVVRVFQSNGKMSNSVEYMTSYDEAQKRFYNILAADISNNNITYHAAYIINSLGRTVDMKAFDRRPEKPDVTTE